MGKKTLYMFALLMLSLVISTQASSSSLSPTTVTISKPLHFTSPTGEDLVVEPGSYKVSAKELALVLTREGTEEYIMIRAQAPPVVEDQLSFPFAMAIPVQDDGIYLALTVPHETGLEAMGSYSGIQTRGAGVLSTKNAMSPSYRQQLNALATRLARDPNEPSLKKEWRSLVQEEQPPIRTRGISTVHAKLVHVYRQLALQKQQELRDMAAQQRELMEKKKALREKQRPFKESRGRTTQGRQVNKRKILSESTKPFEQELKNVTHSEKKRKAKIQKIKSRYKRAYALAASVLKKKADTSSSVIQKE